MPTDEQIEAACEWFNDHFNGQPDAESLVSGILTAAEQVQAPVVGEDERQELHRLRKLVSSTHKNPVVHENCTEAGCPICDGGLFMCADCGAAEIETEQRLCSALTGASAVAWVSANHQYMTMNPAEAKAHALNGVELKPLYAAPVHPGDGWVLVPNEPTGAMIEAGASNIIWVTRSTGLFAAASSLDIAHASPLETYKRMIAAAPTKEGA